MLLLFFFPVWRLPTTLLMLSLSLSTFSTNAWQTPVAWPNLSFFDLYHIYKSMGPHLTRGSVIEHYFHHCLVSGVYFLKEGTETPGLTWSAPSDLFLGCLSQIWHNLPSSQLISHRTSGIAMLRLVDAMPVVTIARCCTHQFLLLF